MTQTLSCGCTVPYDEDESEDLYCATWQEVSSCEFPNGDVEYAIATCYGLLCDKHLVSYNAERCKLGGSKL